MLLKITASDLTTLATSFLSVNLLSAPAVPIDLTSKTPLTTWFSLDKLVDVSTSSNITISSVSIVDAATGSIKVTFDATASTVALGDILCLSGGTVISDFGRVLATSTIDTGLGTITSGEQGVFIKAPKINTTKDTPYKLNLQSVTLDGTGLSESIFELPVNYTINGLSVLSIKLTAISATTVNVNDTISFKVSFYSQAGAQGNL